MALLLGFLPKRHLGTWCFRSRSFVFDGQGKESESQEHTRNQKLLNEMQDQSILMCRMSNIVFQDPVRAPSGRSFIQEDGAGRLANQSFISLFSSFIYGCRPIILGNNPLLHIEDLSISIIPFSPYIPHTVVQVMRIHVTRGQHFHRGIEIPTSPSPGRHLTPQLPSLLRRFRMGS
ncbi:hypothetical protein B0O99DRAFT_374979 [Bisporella sp. PMI_857]|nr:hypothetical protein B0O99DRAFT_374979 [Bisporella sp. PMI_857]